VRDNQHGNAFVLCVQRLVERDSRVVPGSRGVDHLKQRDCALAIRAEGDAACLVGTGEKRRTSVGRASKRCGSVGE